LDALEAKIERLNDVLVKRFALLRLALDPQAPPV
jgi:hypothetical protein